MSALQDLTDQQLLDELTALAEEARDRLEDKVDDAAEAPAALGAAHVFHERLEIALSPKGGGDFFTGSLYGLERRLEKIAAAARLEDRFDSFLAEHPELGATPAARRRPRPRPGAPAPAPRQVNETALREAVTKALEEYGGPYVTASMVASALFGKGPISHAERIRVGKVLGRLSRAGQVRRIERKGHESYGWTLPDKPCRGCGEPFPYDPEADFCPRCADENAGVVRDA